MSQNGSKTESAAKPETEVVAKAKQRQYTADYKLQILRELDGDLEEGKTGAVLRREGLYSSHLTTWRRQSPPVILMV